MSNQPTRRPEEFKAELLDVLAEAYARDEQETVRECVTALQAVGGGTEARRLLATIYGQRLVESLLHPSRKTERDHRALTRMPDPSAAGVFNMAGLVLPKRIVDEDLYDQLEDINRMKSAGFLRWQIWVKIFASIFWAFVKAWKTAGESTSKAKR